MCRAVDEAHAIDEVKNIRDEAIALQAYARQTRNREAENQCKRISRTRGTFTSGAGRGSWLPQIDDQSSRKRQTGPVRSALAEDRKGYRPYGGCCFAWGSRVIDARLTKLTGALLSAVRDQVDHLIGGGLVDKEQLRLSVQARDEIIPKLREKGMSIREIATSISVPKSTVHDVLSETGRNSSETGQSQQSRRESIRQKNEAIAAVEPNKPAGTFET